MNRRSFCQTAAALFASQPHRSLISGGEVSSSATSEPLLLSHVPPDPGSLLTPMVLSPARWIWYPMNRCLPSTVDLFRRELILDSLPSAVTGWILADSRYKLTVNGERMQWGPGGNFTRRVGGSCDHREVSRSYLRA